MNTKQLERLFVVAGLYDGLLGLSFLLAHDRIFAFFEVAPPNHPAYVEFPALLLMIFGALFVHIATDPKRHRNLIPYGMALKASYVFLAFWYHATSGIPAMWLPWAWMDLGFLFAFAYAWWSISKERSAT
ncbi:hypothetical protein [Tropicimonas aquimaris]|uniref:Uncharacterized protein n=1 Tax=Tropicimonas aquimaris TaxID=914152 RepID=A0ABW3IVB4_9RHOB